MPSQVLLQVAATPGLLPTTAADSLMDSALQLQHQVLPGLKSILGQDYSPMSHLVQQTTAAETAVAAVVSSLGQAGSSGSTGKYVPAAVRKYMQQQEAEARRVQQAVDELKQLEPEDGGHE